MSYTVALASFQPGPSPAINGMVSEDITVTGSGDTTGTYTCQFIKTPVEVLGPFVRSFSGAVVTLSGASLTGAQNARIIGFV